MTEGGAEVSPIPEGKSGGPERWISPNRVVITSGDGRLRSVDVNPALRPILTEQGQKIAQVLEVTLEANPGDKQASLDFTFKKDPEGNYNVLTAGWQSWSSSVAVGQLTDKLVGMRPYQKSLGGKTVPFFEPGPGREIIPSQEGRSYGWVCFRDLKGGENVALGVIPGFDALEGIRFRQEGDSITVSVEKDLEGVLSQRPVVFKIFLGSGHPPKKIPGQERAPGNYADLVLAFSKELAKQAGEVPLMKDRVIGFSWSAYGPGITQDKVKREITAGAGMIDTYIIDDGWEEVSGSLTVNKNKFPDLPRLAQEMKDKDIKPGIWVVPFMIKEKGAGKLPREWFMRDAQGKQLTVQVPMPMPRSFGLDVSVPEFREYLAGKFVELARMGFEVFKVDFIAMPFIGKLQNRDKTSVEYYRQVFQEIRQRVRDELGREIELIGCGAPMMESIGLFNGMRMTADSALAYLDQSFVGSMLPSFLSPLGRVVSFLNERTPLPSWIVSKTNTSMYRDTVAVAARRTLLFQGSHGLILDGVLISDLSVPIEQQRKGRLNQSLLALNSLGIGNLFVGDSLYRVGEEGRKVWRDFIERFKNTPRLEIGL